MAKKIAFGLLLLGYIVGGLFIWFAAALDNYDNNLGAAFSLFYATSIIVLLYLFLRKQVIKLWRNKKP